MGEFLGRFELLYKIAAGGMGEVFLARQQGPVGFEKFLVIKTLLPHLTEDQDFVNMFFDEARIAAMLSHPNIAQIYDLGEASGRYYIAMEYVHGETLRHTQTAAESVKGGLTLGLKCRIIAGAAHALDYAHDARNSAGQPLDLIHRDVSPHNIMIAFSGVVKLVDFGIAKANNKLARTATGVIKGKYAYMSPEQAYGQPLDRRSDVFALGIVFHELLTGERLFKKDSDMDTLRAVADAPIPAPSELTKGIPKALDVIVLKALARKREDRYATCGELQADLEGVILRQRLPATASHLAAFMKGLFPEASAPDALLKLTRPEQAAEEKTPQASNSFLSPAPAPAPRKSGEAALDPEQLQARLAGCAATDQIYGMFLNAVEGAVLKKAGAVTRSQVRKAAEAPKEWVDSLKYPTREFLRVLWRGVEVLAPRVGGIDPAFAMIGDVAFGSLLGSPLAAPLLALPPRPGPELLIRPLIQLIQPMIQPGTRVVSAAAAGAAQVVFKGEVLPLQLYAAVLRAAFGHFQGPMPQLSWEKTMPERVEFNLTW
ncbi:MAG: Serine/threonine-protein kinase Pkn6 [Myxococcaceae bacterium]|nr:Serine/threonine-protein kinase Pkn6 [Myxococcaceae bacterium]